MVRFAPSPTGYLHVGGARTALFNWAFARRHGGIFILRIEDTDRVRSTPQATRRIMEDLLWLGLEWDEGPDPHSEDPYRDQKGDFGPYFQSQRLAIYQEYLNRLIAAGRVYEKDGAWWFRMPGRDITVHDLVLGDVTVAAEKLEDFVVMRSSGADSPGQNPVSSPGRGQGGPTFHFANVVDDLTMGVTHVLRAQEHLMNTPKHLALFEALEVEPPKYAHIPLILNPDGSKMSKRDKAKAARQAALQAGLDKLENGTLPGLEPVRLREFLEKKTDDVEVAVALADRLGVKLPEIDVHDFRWSGYLPEVLVNYLALLGWNPGGNLEKFDREYLKSQFDLERLGKSNARFDRNKLLAFNAQWLQSLDLEEFKRLLQRYAQDTGRREFEGLLADASRFTLFASVYQPRTRTLSDPFQMGRFFVLEDEALEYDEQAVRKVLIQDGGAGLQILREVRTVLENLEDWSPQAIQTTLEALAQRTGRTMGQIAQPLRLAVSGSTVSPPIGPTLAILGRRSALARIDRCLRLAGAVAGSADPVPH